LLLAAVAFAPNLASAITLLLARFALSQWTSPPGIRDGNRRPERAHRSRRAYTNTVRYLTRPIPLTAAASLRAGLRTPILIAGALKSERARTADRGLVLGQIDQLARLGRRDRPP